MERFEPSKPQILFGHECGDIWGCWQGNQYFQKRNGSHEDKLPRQRIRVRDQDWIHIQERRWFETGPASHINIYPYGLMFEVSELEPKVDKI